MLDHTQRLAERFDHHDPHFSDEGVADEVYEALRERCPVAHSDAHGGFWAIAGYPELFDVANDDGHFMKRYGLSVPGMTDISTPDAVVAQNTRLPSNLDPPGYFKLRKVYNPAFAPGEAQKWETVASSLARRLVDEVVERGECDLVTDVFQPFTGIFTVKLVGLDEADWRAFAEPVHESLHKPLDEDDGDDRTRHAYVPTDADAVEANNAMTGTAAAIMRAAEARRADPRDDFITHLVTAEIDGVPLTDMEILANASLVIAGGVDTTIGAMGGALLHLSRHPEDRDRLLAEPELMGTAVEEFLRVFAPVTAIARMASSDVEVAGQQIRRGDPVLLLYRSANRDERVFDRPQEVVLDRKPNRHLTFSAGIHRCPGSNFARMELRVMVEEVLRRLPDYEVREDGVRSQPDISIINSYASMPITFTPGTRELATR